MFNAFSNGYATGSYIPGQGQQGPRPPQRPAVPGMSAWHPWMGQAHWQSSMGYRPGPTVGTPIPSQAQPARQQAFGDSAPGWDMGGWDGGFRGQGNHKLTGSLIGLGQAGGGAMPLGVRTTGPQMQEFLRSYNNQMSGGFMPPWALGFQQGQQQQAPFGMGMEALQGLLGFMRAF